MKKKDMYKMYGMMKKKVTQPRAIESKFASAQKPINNY